MDSVKEKLGSVVLDVLRKGDFTPTLVNQVSDLITLEIATDGIEPIDLSETSLSVCRIEYSPLWSNSVSKLIETSMRANMDIFVVYLYSSGDERILLIEVLGDKTPDDTKNEITSSGIGILEDRAYGHYYEVNKLDLATIGCYFTDYLRFYITSSGGIGIYDGTN